MIYKENRGLEGQKQFLNLHSGDHIDVVHGFVPDVKMLCLADGARRQDFQEGKVQDGPGQAANLGRTEPRHQKAGKQQGIQQKKGTGLEAGTAAGEILCFLFLRK